MNLICMNEAVDYPFCNKDVRDLFLLTQSFYRDGGLGLAGSYNKNVIRKTKLTAAGIRKNPGGFLTTGGIVCPNEYTLLWLGIRIPDTVFIYIIEINPGIRHQSAFCSV